MMLKRMPKRFLKEAPRGVYDIFDHPSFADRYTVFLSPYEFAGDTFVPFLGCSEDPSHPQGVGMHDDMYILDLRAYRDENRKNRVSWLDLPLPVRQAVTNSLMMEEK